MTMWLSVVQFAVPAWDRVEFRRRIRPSLFRSPRRIAAGARRSDEAVGRVRNGTEGCAGWAYCSRCLSTWHRCAAASGEREERASFIGNELVPDWSSTGEKAPPWACESASSESASDFGAEDTRETEWGGRKKIEERRSCHVEESHGAGTAGQSGGGHPTPCRVTGCLRNGLFSLW